MVSSSFSTESGFSRKSKAPSWVARTAVSMVPWPLIITTGRLGQVRCISSRISTPSRPGIAMSSSTRSGGFSPRSSARAASPSGASAGEKPSSESMPASERRMLASSSTIRMRFTAAPASPTSFAGAARR